jgi:hypothetical protein
VTGRRVVLAVALAVIAACGVDPQRVPEPIPGDRLPSATAAPSSTAAERVRVWGTRDGRLVPVFVQLPRATLSDRLRAVLDLGDTGSLSAVPSRTRLVAVDQRGDLVELVLSDELAAVRPQERSLALGQLVLTSTESAAVRRVQVRVRDAVFPLLTGDGRQLTRPLTRDDFVALTAAGG